MISEASKSGIPSPDARDVRIGLEKLSAEIDQALRPGAPDRRQQIIDAAEDYYKGQLKALSSALLTLDRGKANSIDNAVMLLTDYQEDLAMPAKNPKITEKVLSTLANLTVVLGAQD